MRRGKLFWRKRWSQATFEFASAAEHRRFASKNGKRRFPRTPFKKLWNKKNGVYGRDITYSLFVKVFEDF